MDKNCPCRLWTVTLVTSGCLLMGTCPCVSDPYQQLHGHQHTDRQLAPCILLPDLSAALPSLWESVWVQSCFDVGLCVVPAVLCWPCLPHSSHYTDSFGDSHFFQFLFSLLTWAEAGGRERCAEFILPAALLYLSVLSA